VHELPAPGEGRAERTAALLAARAVADDPDEVRRINGEIVQLNRGVALAVAARYRSRGVPLEDLRQAACEGLVKAVARFDPERSGELLTFAVPTIRGEIQRYFRDRAWSIRPPRRVQELQQRLGPASEELCQSLGREPTGADLAAWLDVPQRDVEEALQLHECFVTVSLDRPGPGGLRLAEVVTEPGEDELSRVEARLVLAPAVRRLTDRERRILYLRFVEDRTQAEIGAELGVSQMQVSRLLSRALGELRRQIA
jgi:RNA polymerase sigma-B factor